MAGASAQEASGPSVTAAGTAHRPPPVGSRMLHEDCDRSATAICFLGVSITVTEATLQATSTGSEHRRAVLVLQFGVVGVAGAPGNEKERRALTGAVCELVIVKNSLFPVQCTGGGIISSEAVILP